MILPLASPKDFINRLHPPETKNGMWFIFSKDFLLISRQTQEQPSDPNFELERTLYLGILRETHIFAA